MIALIVLLFTIVQVFILHYNQEATIGEFFLYLDRLQCYNRGNFTTNVLAMNNAIILLAYHYYIHHYILVSVVLFKASLWTDMTKMQNGLENGLINGLGRLPSCSDYTGEVTIILSYKCMVPLIDRKSLIQTSTLPLLQPQSRIKGDVIIPDIT